MIFRPTKFTINQSLAQAAMRWTADVPGTEFFRGASADDRVSLSVTYDLDGEPQTLELLTEGVIDFYHLALTAGREAAFRGQLEGRDQMAHLLDTQYRTVYRNGPAPVVVDGALTIPEVLGLFSASEIARQIAAASGLTLSWECQDYLVHDMFQAVGRPIDLLQSLVRPFGLVLPRLVDVFTEEATVICRQRALVPVAPAENTLSLHDARLRGLNIRKFRTDRIGLVSLQGVSTPGGPDPNGNGGGGGQVPFLTWVTPAPITWPTPLSAAQLNATANVDGEWSYSPAEGTSLDPGNQKLTASFTPTDPNFKSGSVSVILAVQQIEPVIVWANPADVVETTVLGGTQLNATATDPDSFPLDGVFTYKPPSGFVLVAGTKELSVTFSPSDSTHYATATATVTLIVTGTPPPNTPVITWGAIADIVHGEELTATQLNATADVAGIFTYTPDEGVVLSAGLKTLTVHFVPDDPDYEDVTATNTVRVIRPFVTWSRPPDLLVGGALSGAHLSAAANVAGAFVYDPPEGTVMTEVGVFSLSAVFTPTATGPQPINASATLRVVAEPVGSGGGTTWIIVVEGSSTDFAAGRSITVTHTQSTYRMPGSLLIGEVKSTYTTPPGQPTNLEQEDIKILTYEDTVLGPDGVAANQPRQLYETTESRKDVVFVEGREGFFTIGFVRAVIATTSMVYTYDDPAKDARGLLVSTVETEMAAKITTVPAFADQLVLKPSKMTKKSYRDHTPDFYVVTTDVYEWRAVLGFQGAVPTFFQNIPLKEFEWVRISHDESPASGTRPGGINSGGGAIPVGGVAGDLPVLDWQPPDPITYPTALTDDQLNATADVAGGFVYAPGPGAILKPGSQHLLATFTPADTTFKVATVSATLSVSHGTPVITWADPDDIVEGTALSTDQLNATADVGGIFTYSPIIGRVMKAGFYTLKVTFTPADSGYETVTASVSLTVTGTPAATTPTLSWASPDAVSEGVRLSATQLDATANDDVPGVFAYSPPAGTALAAGVHTLHVFFTPDDEVTYTTATASVSLTVINTTLSWGKPADVPVGTALDDAQLSATANVDGTFVYNPVAGMVVGAVGTVTLNVTFTPADGGSAVSKSVTLRVIDAGAGGGTGPGSYASVERRIDPDPTATPLGLSDGNLDQATLNLIMEQVAECSGLWQWEVSFVGAGIPWLRRGSLLQLTDCMDHLGNEVVIPTFLIQSVNLAYDQVGSKSVSRDVVGLAWTVDP